MKNVVGKIALAGLTFFGGSYVIDHFTNFNESRIVAGVDAEVVGGDHETGIGARSRSAYLEVTQCGKDADAALHGKLHQETFRQSPLPPDAACVTESVTVDDPAFYKTPKGSVVVFAGDVGKKVDTAVTLSHGLEVAKIASVVYTPPHE